MNKNLKIVLIAAVVLSSIAGLYIGINQKITLHLALIRPKLWGLDIPGIKTRLNTGDKVIALTFDACGGKGGSGYDKKLIRFLKKEKVPATLFINARWIDANLKTFMGLAANPLFEIENHGLRHKPLSVSGKSAYGIKGTQSSAEVFDEVDGGGKKILNLTGRKPKYFRSGTAHYDEIALRILKDMGYQAIGFAVNGDLGATASAEGVKANLLSAKPGSIVIMHMNHPEGYTAEGVIKAIPLLKKKGYRFVKLAGSTLK
ncbi:MAG: polysaccharide deacetylase family protein [Candidatus Margulisiibacteriota bacterium]